MSRPIRTGLRLVPLLAVLAAAAAVAVPAHAWPGHGPVTHDSRIVAYGGMCLDPGETQPPSAGTVLRITRCYDDDRRAQNQEFFPSNTPAPGTVTQIKESDTTCVDTWPSGGRTLAVLEPCNDSASQRWSWADVGTTIVNQASGQCLDSGASIADLTQVVVNPCPDGGPGQRWQLWDGRSKLVSSALSGVVALNYGNPVDIPFQETDIDFDFLKLPIFWWATNLPPGLSIDDRASTSGIATEFTRITGTPTVAGVYFVTVFAEDISISPPLTAQFYMNVRPSAVVPWVISMDQSSAQSLIQSRGLTVGNVSNRNDCVSPGDVETQNPSAGSQVEPGSAVNLTISVCSSDGGGGSGGR
jgi:hypothetical protein